MRLAILLLAVGSALRAQEAASGFGLSTTLTEGATYTHQLSAPPRDGSPITGGFRMLLYPTWKLSGNWTLAGAVQIHSRPFFFEERSTQGYGVRSDILQLHLSYAKFWSNRSVVVRVGQLSSAFGSFLLRYDDADNALIDMPVAYGYYYKNVTTNGLAGAQVDLTLRKLDLRAQFVNSSPANRRSIFDRDQYGNWSGGAGYTIRQGFRAGVSAYRGPYLDRRHPRYFPGEAKPRDLPGSGYGLDVQWGRGHWNANGEWQRFVMEYRAIPTFTRTVGYAEARRVLHPRWYAAARATYMRPSRGAGLEVYELALGFRPSARQLVKVGYQVQHGPAIRGTLGNTLAVQYVIGARPVAIGAK